MKKAYYVVLLLALTLTSCGESPVTTTSSVTSTLNSSVSTSSESIPTSSSVLLKSFDDAVMPDVETTYDGNPHSLMVTGLPEETTVVYSKTDLINAGIYPITASLTKKGYVDKTLAATLTIIKAEISGLSFASGLFEYDSFEHSLEVTGSIPDDCYISYFSSDEGCKENVATEVGTYSISATIFGENHKSVTLNAVLTIYAQEKQMYSYVQNNKLYFQNDLDNDSLYSYNFESKSINKVNHDRPQYITEANTNSELVYRSDSFIPSIKGLNTETNIASTYAVCDAEYLKAIGNTIYYSINTPLSKNKGIYCFEIGQDNEPVSTEPTEIYSGKATDLNIIGNKIFFLDNDDEITYVDKDSLNGLGTHIEIMDDNKAELIKATELTSDGTDLYYNVNKLLGNYLAKYVLSSNTQYKLTSDSARYITVDGDTVYYSSVDKANTAIFGKGLYKVSNENSNNILPGTLIISDANQDLRISSLTYCNGIIYFYAVNNKHIYSWDISSKVLIDLLANFTAPESSCIPESGITATYKTRIYFKNNYEDGALFYLDTVTNKKTRVSSEKIVDFIIEGDSLIYNQVTFGLNNDLYISNLRLGGISKKLSINDCKQLTVSDNVLYYTLCNAAGFYTEIHKVNLDGTQDVTLSQKGGYNLKVANGYLYYIEGTSKIDSGKIARVSISSGLAPEESNITTTQFEISGNTIYCREMYGLLNGSKALTSIGLDFDNKTRLITENTDPVHFIIDDGKIYYYNDVLINSSVNNGVYVYDISSRKITKIIDSTYHCSGLRIFSGKLYFYNYSEGSGDSHFYSTSFDGSNIVRIS
jgi:hypothetical protein